MPKKPDLVRIHTPLDSKTPDVCRSDEGRLMDADDAERRIPHRTDDDEHTCRCYTNLIEKHPYHSEDES